MAKLAAETGMATRRHGLLTIIAIGGGAVLMSVLGLLFWMAFLGNDAQAAMALSILKIIGIGGGGYGLIGGIVSGIKHLLDRTPR
jgi:predicted small integral membrane protein